MVAGHGMHWISMAMKSMFFSSTQATRTSCMQVAAAKATQTACFAALMAARHGPYWKDTDQPCRWI
jgi:hypothetical protein